MLSPCLQCSSPSPCPANPVHPTGHHFRTPGLCVGLFQMPPEHQYLSPPHPVLMEKATATHSSTLAWKIPWAEEPGGLQSMGSRRVGHDWVTSLSRIGEGNGSQLQYSCLENPRDGRAWWAAIYGVAQSRTRLKRLSMHACLHFLPLWVLSFHLVYSFICCAKAFKFN